MAGQTLIRLGYVAMSVNLQAASPSQTMTYKRFRQIPDRDAAIIRLESIAKSNIHHCLRLLKHNAYNGIAFFRLSSRLIPLATHPDLHGWDYMSAVAEEFKELGRYANEHDMRLDFHPDHFNVINTPKKDILKSTIINLDYHIKMLRAMDIEPTHRLVLHVGGVYKDKPQALERFVSNWAYVPMAIQKSVMLENDDKSFDIIDALYLCEKLGVPMVFDLHHHLANHVGPDWKIHWHRIIKSWENSTLPIKMHISSPKNEKEFRSHADYVDPEMFLPFLKEIDGSVPQLDCMIEAKQKDSALFKLVEDLDKRHAIEKVSGGSFYLK
ncbi:MAG: UV DNA damage repair endonuclease UvsE [Tuberibacillus sp.]